MVLVAEQSCMERQREGGPLLLRVVGIPAEPCFEDEEEGACVGGRGWFGKQLPGVQPVRVERV